jgi:anti-sigma-K factor RskA
VTCAELAEQLEAYALGILDAATTREVERHLAACPRCRADLAAVHEVVQALPLAVDLVDPPPTLGRRIQARARREALARWLLGRWSLVAALLALTFATTLWAFSLQGRVDALARERDALAGRLWAQGVAAQILLAPDTAPRELVGSEVAPSARGRLYVNPSRDTALLLVENLPPLPEGRAYQLWLIEGDRRASGGVFRVDESGRGYLLVRAAAPLAAYDAVGVTDEPAGGSPGPTGSRVLAGSL